MDAIKEAPADLKHSELLELLCYDADTGIFRWVKNRCPHIKAGDLAGCVLHQKRGQDYWRIMVKQRRYAAHRLAWFFVHGCWPTGEIDHINGNVMDNRISNLRDVTRIENAQNLRRARSDSTTGLIGVCRTRSGRFGASISVRGVRKYLGWFESAHEAHEAYVAAKRRLHPTCTI